MIKIKIKTIIAIIDENYAEISSRLTRDKILRLDRLTTDLLVADCGEHWFGKTSDLAKTLATEFGLDNETIEKMVLKRRKERGQQVFPTRSKDPDVEDLVIALEGFVAPKDNKPFTLPPATRAELIAKLEKMTPAQRDRLTKPIKAERMTIEQFLSAKDTLEERDKEFERFMKRGIVR